MNDLYTDLKRFGKVKTNEPMAKHTTFKIGGPAEFFVIVSETEKLVELLKFLDGNGTPYIVVGGGSNMLASDEGFRGVVVSVATRTTAVENETMIADAGAISVEVAQQSIKANLTGFEWGVGVPGTIGGAVRGNAGAMGGEIKDVVLKVEVYLDGEIKEFSHADCTFRYRHSFFKDNGGVVLRVWLALKKATDNVSAKKAIEHLQYRNKTQPQGWASTGCIFQNYVVGNDTEVFLRLENAGVTDIPPQFKEKGIISAGWLIDKAGLKGAQNGKAIVSDRHGNFIVNRGGATAHEVLALIEKVKQAVYTHCRVSLEEEIFLLR